MLAVGGFIVAVALLMLGYVGYRQVRRRDVRDGGTHWTIGLDGWDDWPRTADGRLTEVWSIVFHGARLDGGLVQVVAYLDDQRVGRSTLKRIIDLSHTQIKVPLDSPQDPDGVLDLVLNTADGIELTRHRQRLSNRHPE